MNEVHGRVGTDWGRGERIEKKVHFSGSLPGKPIKEKNLLKSGLKTIHSSGVRGGYGFKSSVRHPQDVSQVTLQVKV